MRHWGADLLGPNRTRFSLWAPDLDELTLEFEDAASIPMARADDGWFHIVAPVGAGARYRFRINRDLAVPDPASRLQSEGVHGWSVVVDPNSYQWRQQAWRGRPWTETIIQEVHAGVLGGYTGIAERLVELRDLGITAIELMPIGAFSGQRNWGYDGVLPFAPAECYGAPDELKALIDRAHELGLMVFLDVVYNHFGPDGNYLHAYAKPFFNPNRQTPWGDAIAVEKEPVYRFFLENALMWIEEFRFDGLRFDAVHAIGDNAFLDRLCADIRRQVRGGRHVHLVLENESNDAERLDSGRYDAQWNDDFHNVVHVLLTGETSAYYRDFAERPAERLARCLAEGFIYQGEPSPNHDGHPRGKPSGHLAPTSFVAFLQNHDQVGNRAMGERLTLLTPRQKLRAATALLLLSPQIPLLFMGDEVGSHSPFLFFTDFHDELADAVREGRRKEFAKFPAFADEAARKQIPDPNASETFTRSRPEPGPEADAWRRFYKQLLDLRSQAIVPHLPGCHAIEARAIGEAAVMASWRLGNGATLTIAANLGDDPQTFAAPSTEPLFVEGAPGAPGSIAVWIET